MSDKDFKLKSSSEGFDSRTKDIFANIDSLASKSASNKQEKSEERQPRNNRDFDSRNRNSDTRNRDSDSRNGDFDLRDSLNRKRTEEFKGRESIFRSPNESGWPPARSRHDRKRPHGNPRGPRRTPDHVVNPNKYTKYDLSDVSKDQMSDRSNSRAAFDFLRQMKERKKDETDSDEDKNKNEDLETKKVSFKKPSTFKKPSNPKESSSTSAVQDGHKRIMPECIVGQKAKLKSNVKSDDSFSKTSEKPKIKKSSKTISLSHLDEEDEESD